MNIAQENGTKTKKTKAAREVTVEAGEAIRDRIEHVRDVVEDVRERAEVTFREKPYLVPVAAGAVGFGVGLLFGSKITRFLVLTAVGTVMSEVVGGEVKRLAGDFLSEFQNRLTAGESEDSEEIEAREPAV